MYVSSRMLGHKSCYVANIHIKDVMPADDKYSGKSYLAKNVAICKGICFEMEVYEQKK